MVSDEGIDEFGLVGDLADQLGLPPERAATAHRVDVDVELSTEAAAEIGLTSRSATISGIRWGDPEAPITEVFLHSGGQNAHAWDRVLLWRTTSAIAFDLPGHGYSSWLEPSAYLPRQMALFVRGAIEAVAPQMTLLVGASLGGLTSIHLMSRHPGLADRLVIVDVTPGSTPDRALGTTEFMDGHELFDSFDAMVEHTRTFRPTVSERSLRRSLSHQAKQLPGGLWTWRPDRRDPNGVQRQDIVFADIGTYWDDVARLQVPTMLVVAGDSPIITQQDVDHFLQLAPHTQVVELPGVGHAVHTQVPAKLSALIDGFTAAAESHHPLD